MKRFRRVGAVALTTVTAATLPLVVAAVPAVATTPVVQVPVAGGATSGPADKLQLRAPSAMAVDGTTAHIATSEGFVVVDLTSAQRSLVADSSVHGVTDVAVLPDGTRYVLRDCRIYRAGPAGFEPVTTADSCPDAIAVGPDGKLYFDNFAGIYRLDSDASATLVYSSPVHPMELLFAPNGYLYVGGTAQVARIDLTTGVSQVIAGTGVLGQSGDGGPATAAKFAYVTSVARGGDGRVFIYDTDLRSSARLTTIEADGTLRVIRRYTGAGNLPEEIATSPAGLLVVRSVVTSPDISQASFVGDDEARSVGKLEVQPVEGGPPSTLAGSVEASWFAEGQAATDAVLAPDKVVVAPTGDIFVALSDLHRVAVVGTDGRIRTFAGTGIGQSTGDGGPASAAGVRSPCGLAIHPDGGLLVGEHEWAIDGQTGHAVIRYIAPDGTISTIAGTGPVGYSAADAPASSPLRSACTIAAGPDGTVYFADTTASGFRIRAVQDGVLKTLVESANPSAPVDMNTDVLGSLYARSLGRYGFRLEPSGVLAAYPDNDVCLNRLDVFDAAGNAVYVCGSGAHLNGQGVLQRELVDGTFASIVIDTPAHPVGFDAAGRLVSTANPFGTTTVYAIDGLGVPLTSPYFAARAVAVTDGHVRTLTYTPQSEQSLIERSDVEDLANTTWYNQAAFDRSEGFSGGFGSRVQTIDTTVARSRSDAPLVVLFADTAAPIRIEGARADVFARCDGTVSGGTSGGKIEVSGIPVGPLPTGPHTFSTGGYTFHLNEKVHTPQGVSATAVRIEFSHPAKSPTGEARSTLMVAHADAHAVCPA